MPGSTSLGQIYNLIIDNTDNIDNKNTNYQGLLGSGRLNIYKTLEAAGGISAIDSALVIAPASEMQPLVQIFNSNGHKQTEFLAYDINFKGGVNLASVDFASFFSPFFFFASLAFLSPHLPSPHLASFTLALVLD